MPTDQITLNVGDLFVELVEKTGKTNEAINGLRRDIDRVLSGVEAVTKQTNENRQQIIEMTKSIESIPALETRLEKIDNTVQAWRNRAIGAFVVLNVVWGFVLFLVENGYK
jgi:ABC-type transporter Mla subunit MlaD